MLRDHGAGNLLPSHLRCAALALPCTPISARPSQRLIGCAIVQAEIPPTRKQQQQQQIISMHCDMRGQAGQGPEMTAGPGLTQPHTSTLPAPTPATSRLQGAWAARDPQTAWSAVTAGGPKQEALARRMQGVAPAPKQRQQQRQQLPRGPQDEGLRDGGVLQRRASPNPGGALHPPAPGTAAWPSLQAGNCGAAQGRAGGVSALVCLLVWGAWRCGGHAPHACACARAWHEIASGHICMTPAFAKGGSSVGCRLTG